MIMRRVFLLAALASIPAAAAVSNAQAPQPTGPAYQIVLRSRHAEVTPTRSKDAQTGGGAIVVDQPEPHTIVVTMTGSAAVGSDFHRSYADMAFSLEQDLDIIPTRKGVRPPRIGMVGRVVGTLQVTDPGLLCKPCGTAEQGPASACLSMGGTGLLSLNVKSSNACCGQELSINHREGPVESPAVEGSYRLASQFRLGVNRGLGVFHRQYAVADFDPAPQFDAFWADALRPFRAVPRKDFGFRLVVRVVEDGGAADAAPAK